MILVRFASSGGTVAVQQSIDDVAANYEAVEKPDGESFTTTTTKSYVARGRMFYRMVGSGGIVNAVLEWHPLDDASNANS